MKTLTTNITMALIVVIVSLTLTACGGGGGSSSGNGTPAVTTSAVTTTPGGDSQYVTQQPQIGSNPPQPTIVVASTSSNPVTATSTSGNASVTISTAALDSGVYHTSTPGAVTGSISVAYAGSAPTLSIVLSNKQAKPGSDFAFIDFQPMLSQAVSLSTPGTHAFSSETGIVAYMIEPAPAPGVTYAQPTYVIVSACVNDTSSPRIQEVCAQKALPIAIMP